jgi:putative hemolysin
MTSALVEIGVVLLLVLFNGVLAMSEIAVVSARRARLRQRAEQGDKGARQALELAADPERFLSTVQIGISLVGILAGTFAGATLADELAVELSRVPVLARYSAAISVVVVVVAITYLSLVLGELAPKRIALSNAARVASLVARPMQILSVVTYPVVQVLSFSTRVVVRLFGIREMTQPTFTRQELLIMMEEGAEAGVLKEAESDMVEHVFRLADRRVSALMTHRAEIVWLDLDESPGVWAQQIIESNHTLLPVAREDLDEVVGIVHAKDMLARALAHEPLDLEDMLESPLFLPENTPILKALEQFRECRLHIALVIDEYGGIQGLVTTTDLLEAIVGDMPVMGELFEPEAVLREDGSWLLDGLLPIDEFKELLDIADLPGEAQGYYETLGGFVMRSLGRIPATGDHFEWDGRRFEIVDMDGFRVDKVLVVPPREETDA